jgi:hypothetical protein
MHYVLLHLNNYAFSLLCISYDSVNKLRRFPSDLVPGMEANFCLFCRDQTGSGAHQACYQCTIGQCGRSAGTYRDLGDLNKET